MLDWSACLQNISSAPTSGLQCAGPALTDKTTRSWVSRIWRFSLMPASKNNYIHKHPTFIVSLRHLLCFYHSLIYFKSVLPSQSQGMKDFFLFFFNQRTSLFTSNPKPVWLVLGYMHSKISSFSLFTCPKVFSAISMVIMLGTRWQGTLCLMNEWHKLNRCLSNEWMCMFSTLEEDCFPYLTTHHCL